MTELEKLIREITADQVVIIWAENIRPGHVTLYGVVTDVDRGDRIIQLNMFGGTTKTVKVGDRLVVLGDMAALSLAEINAGQ